MKKDVSAIVLVCVLAVAAYGIWQLWMPSEPPVNNVVFTSLDSFLALQ